ncbi:MAG: peptidylprolyl isomerase [Phycisphaerae bacterium]
MKTVIPTFALLLLSLSLGGCPPTEPFIDGLPLVTVETSAGSFVIETNPDRAPITVENFLIYVEDGFYDGLIFHRVVPNFVIQGGGFLPDLTPKPGRPPIANESRNGLSNAQYTVAMARTDDPNSASSQFFVNVVDNPGLDPTIDAQGYAVFGRVIEGTDVVQAISRVETATENGFMDVPVEDVVILSTTMQMGEPRLAPEWEFFFADFQFRAQSSLREIILLLIQNSIVGN